MVGIRSTRYQSRCKNAPSVRRNLCHATRWKSGSHAPSQATPGRHTPDRVDLQARGVNDIAHFSKLQVYIRLSDDYWVQVGCTVIPCPEACVYLWDESVRVCKSSVQTAMSSRRYQAVRRTATDDHPATQKLLTAPASHKPATHAAAGVCLHVSIKMVANAPTAQPPASSPLET